MKTQHDTLTQPGRTLPLAGSGALAGPVHRWNPPDEWLAEAGTITFVRLRRVRAKKRRRSKRAA